MIRPHAGGSGRSGPQRRALRALLATAVLGTLLLGTSAVVGAQEGEDEPESTGEEEPAPARVQLTDQTPWVRPGEQLHLWFRTDQPGAGAVQLVIHDPLITRTDFVDTLDNDFGGLAGPTQPWTLDELPRAADGTYEIVTQIGGDGGINLTEHGVYPTELLVTDAEGRDELTSLVTYLLLLPANPEEFHPLRVAVVMEMGGPPGLRPDGSVQPADPTASHLNSRIGALDQAPDVPLTVAPVPETLDTLAAWGEPGQSMLDRLRRAVGNREVLSRPYVDLDLDSLVAAGLLAQTAPESMAGAQVLRDRLREPLEQTWLTGATVGDAEVDALRGLGIGRVVVPESAVEPLGQDEGPVPVGPVELTEDGPQAAVADDTLSSRLLSGDGALGTQQFLAELTMIWLTRPSIDDRAVVVRIPEDAPIEPTVLAKALEALTSAAGAVQPIGLDEYFTLTPVGGDEEPEVVERTDDAATTDLRSLTRPLENAQRTVSGLAGTLEDRARIQSLHRSLLISLGAELTMAQRRAYIDRVGDVVASVSDGINAPPDFKITLTARTGTIPLTIANTTDDTVSVAVLLQSNQLEFPEGDQMNVSVPPGGRRFDLEVRTRTSGAFPLHITLTSPDHNVVYDRTTFTIRSTAVSGVGLVLSIGAGLFLLLWWGRHWRTARRSRRLVGDGRGLGPDRGAEGPGWPDDGDDDGPRPPDTPRSAMATLSSLSSSRTPPPPAAPGRPVPSIPPMLPPPPPPDWDWPGQPGQPGQPGHSDPSGHMGRVGQPHRPGAKGRPGAPPPPGWARRRGTTARRDDPH